MFCLVPSCPAAQELQRADTERESATGEVEAIGGVGRHLAVDYRGASSAALSKAYPTIQLGWSRQYTMSSPQLDGELP